MALPTTAEQYAAYQAAQQKYQRQQTGGSSFFAALQSALAGADQQNTALRSQQQALTQQQYSEPTKYREELIGQGITDPYKRQALLDQKQGNTASNLAGVQGKLADLGGARKDVLDTAGKAYDSETAASLQQANAAGSFFQTLLGNDQSKENMLAQQQFSAAERAAQQKFSSRNDDLERRQMEASIASSNRANRGGGGGSAPSLLELLGLQSSNPLGLAQLKGYTRELAPDGGQGYWFYKNNPDGTRVAVPVDEVANAIGGNKAALLEGSSNVGDQNAIQQAAGKDAKPPTMAQETTALYADRIQQSNKIFEGLDDYAAKLNPLQYAAYLKTPQVLNKLRSGKFQSLDQAQRNFVNAVLRRESGAVINPEEFVNARLQYFPVPGDTPEVVAQKKANRDLVQQRFIQSSGSAYVPIEVGSGAPAGKSDPLGIR